MSTTILAVVADTHCGSTTSICTPNVQLDDGGTYEPSKFQRLIYDRWGSAWERVEQLRKQHGSRRKAAPLWVVHNGDVVDGDHHNTFQTWSRSPNDQIDNALRLLWPIREKAERMFIVRGTEAHTGSSGWMEERIAREMETDPDPVSLTSSWWLLRLQCNQTRFEFAHHATMGRKEQSRGNAANILAVDTLAELAEHEPGGVWPQVVVRSHQHRFADSGLNYKTLRVIYTPGWQLATAFTRRLAPRSLGHIGMLVFVCHDNGYEMIPFHFPPKGVEFWTAPTTLA